MLLECYWPSQKDVNDCIKSQAESTTDAVLLAVHQPTPLSIREAHSLEERTTSEQELLKYFLSDDLPEGTLLLPITGASGAGKSHIIRWLAAQLSRINDDNRYEVVLIPKSANLRKVVELILEPLGGDPRYDELRSNLKTVVSDIRPQDAATRFFAELKISLRSLVEVLQSEIRQDPRSPEAKEKKLQLDHANKLPLFFGDAEVHDYFEQKVFAPIIERSVSGANFDKDGDAITQFAVDDFVLPDELVAKLGSSARQVQLYYQTTLDRDGNRGREQAVEVLNSVIDESIRRVFSLDKAIGGDTLEDIILQIRDLLFEDGRELVLLIEDFAALSGIQKVLLDVCIVEAVRKGKQVRSRMRTALAVTDGYLANRDTILTRAKAEWVIQSHLDDPIEVFERTVSLVGAYLNAARWGASRLLEMFDGSPKNTEARLTNWITVYEDEEKSIEESEILSAFGASVDGSPLFPFNSHAINRLAEANLMSRGRIEFNPRRIIDFIVRRLVLMRDDYERGEFPGPGLHITPPSAEIASWLSESNLPQNQQERLGRFLVIWGGAPDKVKELVGIPPHTFTAFGLPSQQDLGQEYNPKKNRVATPTAEPKTPKGKPVDVEPNRPQDPSVDTWRTKLDEWVAGKELGQQDANKLRNIISTALEKCIDWNALSMSPTKFSWLLILPNARGNDVAARCRIELTGDPSDPTGILRMTLLAAIRLDLAKFKLNYESADEDSALFSNLLSRLLRAVSSSISDQRDLELATIARLLIQQGRILGQAPKKVRYPKDLVRIALNNSSHPKVKFANPDSASAKWYEFQKEVEQYKDLFEKEFRMRLSAYQGNSGKKPLAVDPTRVAEIAESDIDIEVLESSLRSHAKQLTSNRLAIRLKPISNMIVQFHASARDVLGDSYDKNTLIAELNALSESLEQAGIWPEIGIGKRKWKNEIDRFRKLPVKELLDTTKVICDNPTDFYSGEFLSAAGKINVEALEQTEEFIKSVIQFVSSADSQSDIQMKKYEGVDPVGDAVVLDQKMEKIDGIAKSLAGSGVLS